VTLFGVGVWLLIVAGVALAITVGYLNWQREQKRRDLLAQALVVRISLGPRILRADTAGVAALALIEAAFGPRARP